MDPTKCSECNGLGGLLRRSGSYEPCRRCNGIGSRPAQDPHAYLPLTYRAPRECSECGNSVYAGVLCCNFQNDMPELAPHNASHIEKVAAIEALREWTCTHKVSTRGACDDFTQTAKKARS